VLVYLHSSTESTKRAKSIDLFRNYNCITSTQALNEFSNVYIRKYNVDGQALKILVSNIIASCDVRLITDGTVYNAIAMNAQYKYSFYDCLMLASAIDADCEVLFSEDMQNGQIIDNKLTIVNPF
jgi:predicted nucleic acid-binding protein